MLVFHYNCQFSHSILVNQRYTLLLWPVLTLCVLEAQNKSELGNVTFGLRRWDEDCVRGESDSCGWETTGEKRRVGFHEREEGCGKFRPGFGNTIKTKSRATLKMPVCDTHTKDFTHTHLFRRCWNFAVCACMEVQKYVKTLTDR